MEFVQLSDLEEGEILEYDSYSPVDSSDDFEIKNRPFGPLKKETANYNFELKNTKERNLCSTEQEKHGYMNNNLREKLDVNWKLGKSNIGGIDLESISSEGEYKSDDNSKCEAEQKDCTCNNAEKRRKGKHSSHLYGTVEDIMSKIGETICRKSRCNYKKRKSKDFVKYSDNSYDVWRDKIFSSHLKGKNRKRKVRCSDSDSEFSKSRVEKRKKRKKREVYYEEVSGATKKPKMRDFDEMRRSLLEKLKKQKAEELKAPASGSPPEVENSEIQEVDMLIDCTNYVDDPLGAGQENSLNEIRRTQEKDGEDELDLIKLRLIALASNKRRKSGGNEQKTETREKAAEEKKAENSNRGEVDLDRNELLLRAEALKTALLKKHQKRLNKMKLDKPETVGSWNDDVNPPPPPSLVQEGPLEQIGEGPLRKDTEAESTKHTPGENEGENKNEETSKISDVPYVPDAHISESQTNLKEPLVPDVNPKKGNLRGKNKRKKRKSCSLANSMKENNEKALETKERSEALEEDDRTLRSQLLSDLMRKKCLKDLEKKPVLTSLSDVQTSANQIPVRSRYELLKGNVKPQPLVVKKNPLKKVNIVKTSKPDLVPKIPKPEIQRIIVHLGSDDSSDENGEQEDRTTEAQNESETKGNATAESNVKGKEKEIIQANYEKSVELLLSQARKKIEGKMQTAKNNNALTTPEAVYKHLPPSQRLEYLRLKQKIAERERLRKQKSETSTKPASLRPETSNPAGQDVTDSESQKLETPPKPENPLPNNTSDGRDVNSFLKSGVSNSKLAGGLRSANGVIAKPAAPRLAMNKMKNNLAGLHGKGLKKHLAPASVGFKPSPASSSLLLPSSQALISKLKLLLKKIKIEKMIEENYQKEISKLKSQINLFERKKTEQRFKIKKLGEESMKTYRAIQGVTSRSNERTVLKEGNSSEDKKDEGSKHEEKSEEGKKVPFEPETEISKAKSKIDKELNSDGGDKVTERISTGTSLVVSLLEYSSPLQVFNKVSDCSTKVDPNVMMCQFDLMGVCKDEECTYQHLRTS